MECQRPGCCFLGDSGVLVLSEASVSWLGSSHWVQQRCCIIAFDFAIGLLVCSSKTNPSEKPHVGVISTRHLNSQAMNRKVPALSALWFFGCLCLSVGPTPSPHKEASPASSHSFCAFTFSSSPLHALTSPFSPPRSRPTHVLPALRLARPPARLAWLFTSVLPRRLPLLYTNRIVAATSNSERAVPTTVQVTYPAFPAHTATMPALPVVYVVSLGFAPDPSSQYYCSQLLL